MCFRLCQSARLTCCLDVVRLRHMGDLVVLGWNRTVAVKTQAEAIVRFVAPLLKDMTFRELSRAHCLSRHARNGDVADSIQLRVFADSLACSELTDAIEAHLDMDFGTCCVDHTDPMLAPELEWYRKSLSLVTTIAVEVLDTSSIRLSSAIISERDLFTKVGRTIITNLLCERSSTYASMTDEERDNFWVDMVKGSGVEGLPCAPGHWLWNLLAF